MTPEQQKLLSLAINLNAEKDQLYKTYTRKRQEVNEAKERIDLEPAIKESLEKFQQRENEKRVGMNQQLLTAILGDVLGSDGEAREVVLDIFTERGLPGLGIYIEKNQQGIKEDAYSGAGGAVANVLALGLRSIALIQSKQRKFLVLDEPECWVRPDIVPEFISVVKELSERLGIQILMILHHSDEVARAIPHRLQLKKENGRITSEWITGMGCEVPVWEDGDEGIRSIYLENFQSHSGTTISLSKTVTLISGVNDLGKSAVVNALRAIFYGEMNDTYIKHHEESTKVMVDFGDKLLIWKRNLKEKPKEQYILIDEDHGLDNPLHRTDSARGVPEWLQKETGIGYIEDFDIQLGHQKKPVFLLDEPASKRARALAIGDESNYIQKMMKIAKDDLSASKQIVKSGEKEMETIYKSLRIFDKHANDLKDLEEGLTQAFNKVNSAEEDNSKLQDLLMQLKRSLALKALLENCKIEEKHFNVAQVSTIKSMLLDIFSCQDKAKIYNNKFPAEKTFKIHSANVQLVADVLRLQKQNQILAQHIEPFKSHFVKLDFNLDVIERHIILSRLPNDVRNFNLTNPYSQKLIEYEDAKTKANEITHQTNNLIKEKAKVEFIRLKAFDFCPLCKNKISHAH